MAGAAYGYNQFSSVIKDIEGTVEHLGRVVTHQVNLFGLIGFSPRINFFTSLPITRWSQIAEQADAHHRTETLVGVQDLNLGVRYIISNSYLGPGTRIFTGVILSVPTGSSCKTNPFSEGADSTDHRHFALGMGTMQVIFTGEWWHRSEFPWVTGITDSLLPSIK